MNGIININKSAGFTSFDVVAKLRSVLNQKKIGHTGTLDPDATGVLPVCLGNATKVCALLTDMDKTYEAVMLLGQVTDTQDVSGEVLSLCDEIPAPERVKEAVLGFAGEYDQIPPMYSAKKINGKKLYELAREGKTVERKPCHVVISDITILEQTDRRVRFSVTCSKGTYIRTLCHDIGAALGCGACMESLLRTRVGVFSLEDAVTIAEVASMMAGGTIASALRGVDALFPEYPEVRLQSPREDKILYNGNKLNLSIDAPRVRVYDSAGDFKAIYEKSGGSYKPLQMFL